MTCGILCTDYPSGGLIFAFYAVRSTCVTTGQMMIEEMRGIRIRDLEFGAVVGEIEE